MSHNNPKLIANTEGQRYGRKKKILVVGRGSFAKALAQIVCCDCIKSEMFVTRKQLPRRFLESIQWMLLVVESNCSAADVIEQCDLIYKKIQDQEGELGKFHRLAFIFVCPAHLPSNFKTALLNGFGLNAISPSKGVNFWKCVDSLLSLLQRLTITGTADWSELENRRASEPRHRAILQLRTAILNGPKISIFKAAKEVRKTFGSDIFIAFENYCLPPRHTHANQWRSWLRDVSCAVTPQSWAAARRLLPTIKTSIP